MFSKLLDFFAARLREPFTWKGIFLVGSAFLGWEFDTETQIAIMTLGVALAGGVDLLPDSVINKPNNDQLSNNIKNDVFAELQSQQRPTPSHPDQYLKPSSQNSVATENSDTNLTVDPYICDYVFIARQQQILKYLGFYQGKIDGIWGKQSELAKIAFENSPMFAPGLANGGHPFCLKDPLPDILYYNTYRGSLHVRDIDDSMLPSPDQKLLNRLTMRPVEKVNNTNPYESSFDSGFNDR